MRCLCGRFQSVDKGSCRRCGLSWSNQASHSHATRSGRWNGQPGAKARHAALTQEQRTDIARKAAQARWGAK